MNDFRDVVVVGSINQDYLMEIKTRPLPGETITGAILNLQPGGKGSNQAVAAACIGAKVSIVGAVGDDFIGHSLIRSMELSGVDTTKVKKLKTVTTGSAFVSITPDGENSIIVASGANWGLSISDIEQVKQTIACSKVLVLQMELAVPVIEYAISQAGPQTLVILNLAPPGNLAPEALKRVNILVVNEHEAFFLAKEQIIDTQSARQVAAKLLGLGIENVIVTLGSNGALMIGQDYLHIPAPIVSVVDTTGAGDCFVGVLAGRIAAGVSTSQALEQSVLAASLSVQALGAQASFPSLDQITS